MPLPRYIREAGIRAIQDKLAEIAHPTAASLKAQHTKKLKTPTAPTVTKVVSTSGFD